MERWSDDKIAKVNPGRYRLDDNLFLLVERLPSGKITRKFAFIYRRHKKGHGLGLGRACDSSGRTLIKLSTVKAKAAEWRARMENDPRFDPKKDHQTAKLEARREVEHEASFDKTFDWCSTQYQRETEKTWSLRTATLWQRSIERHLSPEIGSVLIDKLTTKQIADVLKPLWERKNATAQKLRTRVEAIWNWAKAHEHVSGDDTRQNPARLEIIKPLVPKITKETKHHAALEIEKVPILMAKLRVDGRVGSLACQFMVLTAGRISEIREAVWSEIDLDGALWRVPKERMKMSRDHEVPLATQALDILRTVRLLYGAEGPQGNHYVFPGERLIGPVGTIKRRLQELFPVTAHGSRSVFTDWCGDEAEVDEEVAEHAVAHKVGGVRGAYRRKTALKKRRPLMQQWADYCYSHGEVVPFKQSA
jgi:integrase